MPDFRIKGNSKPEVGEVQTYSIVDNFIGNIPSRQVLPNDSKSFSLDVDWSIYELRGNKWIHKKKNDKKGAVVQYSFFEATIKYEGLKLIAQKGGQKATIEIETQPHMERKIVYIDFLDALWNKPSKPFVYGDKIIARIHCVNLDGCHGMITLWEDDEPGKSHNNLNNDNKATTLPIYIQDGKAEAQFFLNPSFSKMANMRGDKGTESEGEFHEYYVTVEIFNQKIFESQNIDVANPDYRKTQDKQTPAEQKGSSKKEEKGIKASGEVHDYFETSVNVLAEIRQAGDMVREALNKAMMVDMPDEGGEEKSSICVCKENNFYWSSKLTCKERKKVLEVCAKLWGEDKKKDKASELMAVMHLETGNTNTFKPYADNGAGYSGLIQFSDASAKRLGTTRSALKKMTFIEQMDYVHDYFASKKEISNMVDLYLHVLKPNAVGNGNNPDYILFDESISVPDGDGSTTSLEQRKINIGKEPWVTKYGYYSNPSFMKGDEHTRRRKWVYTKQHFEDRWGLINGNTTIADVQVELKQNHYDKGANQIFNGACENLAKGEDTRRATGERAPWVDIAFSEFEEYKGLREIDSPLKEKINDYFKSSSTGAKKANRTLWGHSDPWCGAFVAWCFDQTNEYKRINTPYSAQAFGWKSDKWANGEDSEPFIGALIVFSFSHVAILVGENTDGSAYVYLGGNQGNGDGRSGFQKIILGSVSKKSSSIVGITKPKKYIISEEDKKLPKYDVNAENSRESSR